VSGGEHPYQAVEGHWLKRPSSTEVWWRCWARDKPGDWTMQFAQLADEAIKLASVELGLAPHLIDARMEPEWRGGMH